MQTLSLGSMARGPLTWVGPEVCHHYILYTEGCDTPSHRGRTATHGGGTQSYHPTSTSQNLPSCKSSLRKYEV